MRRVGAALFALFLGPALLAAQNAGVAASDSTHAFLDSRNSWLFSGVAVTRVLDFHSTRDMRRRGRDEILLTNGIVDNTPLFVGIEVGGALASYGLSYLLHSHGRHRLERWASYLHIGITTFGAARNYLLDSARERAQEPMLVVRGEAP